MRRVLRTGGLIAAALILAAASPAPDAAREASVAALTQVPPSEFSADERLYAGSDGLALYIAETGCRMTLRDTAHKTAYPLVPGDADDDPIASDDMKSRLKSHLLIVWSGSDGVENTMNSYADSVAKNQYAIYKIKNGVRITYTFGTPPDVKVLVPQRMTRRAYDELIGFYTDDARVQKRLKYFFSLVSLDFAKTDAQRREMLEAYPVLESYDIYVARSLSAKEAQELVGYFERAGWTFETIDEQYRLLGYTEKTEKKPCFVIPVDYTVKDGRFAADIPADEIDYDHDAYTLEKITLLPYFGAVGGGEGYLFFPDGSGSLLRFGEGLRYNKLYATGKVYGDEVGVEQSVDGQCYRLPVFGIKSGESALFANITDGEAYAEITTEAGHILSGYYASYASFTHHYKLIHVLSNSDIEQRNWPVFAAFPNGGHYRVTYALLFGEKADISGMAELYRGELLAGREPLPEDEGIPLYLDALGMINVPGNVMGVTVQSDVPLTTFGDVSDMAAWLRARGVGDIVVKLSGWANGGLNYTAPAAVKPAGKLGGLAGLRALLAEERDGKLRLAPSYDLGFVRADKLFDGFYGIHDAARTVEGKLSSKRQARLSTGRLESAGKTVINSRSAARYAGVIERFGTAESAGGAALDGIGGDVYGSYKKNAYIPRQQSVETYRRILSGARGRLMIEAGNAYALPYADDVLSLPACDSAYPGYGEPVSFVQMVLHGTARYTAAPVNLSEDVRPHTLRCIETGSAPLFTVAARNTEALRRDNEHSRYYAVDFTALEDTIVDCYREISEALKPVQGRRMTASYQLTDKVRGADYDNGVTILVNYSQTDYTDSRSGATVPAGGYIRVASGEGKG